MVAGPLRELRLIGELSGAGPAGTQSLPLGKPVELLIYLALRPEGAPRVEVAEALWPEADRAVARHRLRTTLFELRAIVGDALRADRDRIALDPVPTTDLDSDADGTFAPGLRSAWIEEVRANRDMRRAMVLALQAQEIAGENKAGALELLDRAVRLAPEASAPRAIRERFRGAEEPGLLPAEAILTPREQVALALARAPLDRLAGRLRGPASRLDALLEERVVPEGLKPKIEVAAAGLRTEAGEYDAAMGHLRRALAGKLPPPEAAWAYVWLGRCEYWSGRHHEARRTGERAAKLGAEAGEPVTEVVGIHIALSVELMMNRIDSARASAERARAAAGKDPYLRARCAMMDGWISSYTGEWRRAQSAFEATLAGGAISPDVGLVAAVRRGLSRSLEARGETAAARALLEEALAEITDTDFEPARTLLLTHLAEQDEREGRFEEALAEHLRCLASRARTGERVGLTTSLVGAGRALWRLGRSREAAARFREAFALHTELFGDVRFPAVALPLAETLVATGRLAEARRLLERSEEILREERGGRRQGGDYSEGTMELLESLRQAVGATFAA